MMKSSIPTTFVYDGKVIFKGRIKFPEIKILIWARGTGKTTRCIDFLRENPDACLFVPSLAILSRMPNDVRKRVFSWRNRHALVGKRFRKCAIDEPDLMDEEFLYDVEKYLKVVFIAGTPFRSYKNPNTWLRKKIDRHGYIHKECPPDVQRMMKSQVSPDDFNVECLAKLE